MPHQVDEYVHLICEQPISCLRMGQFSQVDKLVTFLLDAVPMLAAVVFTTGVAVDREASVF